MDYDKKDPRMFDEVSAQKQMADAFSRDEPQSEVSLGEGFKLPSSNHSSRKIQTTYTIRPEIKQGIEKLASKQGFRSSSAFVDLVLEQVLNQSK
ncbi:hypothetical protein FE407_08525 [Leuconostoc carnosum]|uniref:hypothetical protein n=2 Tax=Leuconostoc TaxID=1243 RepID=UPI0002195FAC|nr:MULTISPECIES: hypothetical protein [Leuconostoc]KDA47658.1 hypothetical protein L964_166 [Leuconostoc pseudomesenteroides 1159]MDN6013859.1 hypothetical protein [Lactococcus sp.]KAA8346644.1 hypothetical protein FE418_09470 [Leuconostoc mesenteroides]KAA8358042.1 hypothetical protein FE407_08525 [Leuconostoc carnosum]KAA8364421.1 hypothetical protein FE406_08685 [Leuconostoc carnosum]